MATHRETGNSVAASQVEGAATDEDSVLEVWCIEALAAELNGAESTIARAALSVLEEASKEERCVRILVSPALSMATWQHVNMATSPHTHR